MLTKSVAITISRTTLFGRITIFLFVFFLLFSNIISRIIEINVNGLFYLAVIMAFVVSMNHFKLSSLNFINLLLITVFLLYVLDPRNDLKANLYSVKDFAVPLICFFIGGGMVLYRTQFVNIVNYLFTPFVLYGVLQQYAFYTGSLDSILPWDNRMILELQEAGVKNLFQGILLRFFGTMNAFVEYQVLLVVLMLFLWLEKNIIKSSLIFKLNIAACVVFIIFSLERSPILMLMIHVFIWKYDYFFTIKKIISSAFISSAFITLILSAFLVLFFSQYLSEENPITGDAYRRIVNVLTLNFKDDSAISDRTNTEWKKSLELVSENYMGVGPGRVSPAAQDLDGAVQPHNNYLVYLLGYGLLGFGLFIYFIFAISYSFFKRRDDIGRFGLGITASFLAMSMFNVPFAGKNGVVYFLLCGLLLRTHRLKERSKIMFRNPLING